MWVIRSGFAFRLRRKVAIIEVIAAFFTGRTCQEHMGTNVFLIFGFAKNAIPVNP